MNENEIKNFYRFYADKIIDKRLNSPYVLRRYYHQQDYSSILKYLKPGERVLEIGCGEGILAVFMAKKGLKVTALDISKPNLESAKNFAEKNGVREKIEFVEGDAENLPFESNSFEVVIADNVLEHLPNFYKGLEEIKRVMKKRAIIVLPACFLNPCALALLGGDVYWKITRRTPYAILKGLLKVIWGIFTKKEGVNEWYSGQKGKLPHLWRYPWVIDKSMKKAGLKILHYEAISFCLPYFKFFLPLIKFLDKFKDRKLAKIFGMGALVVVGKSNSD